MGIFDMFKNKKSDTAKDPVCGMAVNLAATEYKSIYQGKQYGFCSESCKKTFDQNSSQYGKSAEGSCC